MSADLVSSVYNLHPHACLFIDATWTDLMKAYKFCLVCDDRITTQKAIQKMTHPHSLVTISARTAFDLWLRVKNFPKGSEIVLSAINIPDMVKVIREAGLIPVPVDVCFDTLVPTAAMLNACVTSKTVAIMIAQIFGRQSPLQELAEVATRIGVPLIEDLAEGWCGPSFTGSPQAQLTLFSFGPIKFNTSFGGGMAILRDEATFIAMEKLHESYNIRSRSEMLQKIAKYSLVMLMLNVPVISGTVMRVCSTLGIDHKAYVVAALRGFPSQFFEKLRHRPDAAMLAMLENRMKNFDINDHMLSNQKGELLTKSLMATDCAVSSGTGSAAGSTSLGSNVMIVPGQACPTRNYWLYPLLVENPHKTMAELNDIGIDSYRGATQLNLVDRPEEYKAHMVSPPNAKLIVDKMIYIPIHKRASIPLVKKLAGNLVSIARRCNIKAVFPSTAKHLSLETAALRAQVITQSTASISPGSTPYANSPDQIPRAQLGSAL